MLQLGKWLWTLLKQKDVAFFSPYQSVSKHHYNPIMPCYLGSIS